MVRFQGVFSKSLGVALCLTEPYVLAPSSTLACGVLQPLAAAQRQLPAMKTGRVHNTEVPRQFPVYPFSPRSAHTQGHQDTKTPRHRDRHGHRYRHRSRHSHRHAHTHTECRLTRVQVHTRAQATDQDDMCSVTGVGGLRAARQ